MNIGLPIIELAACDHGTSAIFNYLKNQSVNNLNL